MRRIIIFTILSFLFISSIITGCIELNNSDDSTNNNDDSTIPDEDTINTSMINIFKKQINTVVKNYSIYFHETINYLDVVNNINYKEYYGFIFNEVHSIILYYNDTLGRINISQSYTPDNTDEMTAYSIISESRNESYLMVPASIEKISDSLYEVGYQDGWCYGCEHPSGGYAEVNIEDRTYQLTKHVI